MTTPDVTVIVPVYNTMPYLRACLDSLVDQTLGQGRLQAVTVDDGSTDGSGELLDEYAARHPGLFTVVHQENSGGPATPCNRGLDLATGRYVFFLGADDYLGPEALERLVTKADEWGSDVVAGKMVGLGGRWVSQKLYGETLEDVPFPSTLLASALSNTKLFRRSLIESRHLRYFDLRPGEDQPFTIEAMLFARKVSVLADYDYYFAVKREDEQNITYTATWRARLQAMTTILQHVAGLIPAGAGRDSIFGRHFAGEVATLLRRDFADLNATDQEELVAGVNALTAEFLTPGISARLKVLARLRYSLAREEDLDGLRALVGAEDGPVPIVVEGDRVFLAYAGFRDRFADEVYQDDVRSLRLHHVVQAVGAATVDLEETTVVLAAPAALKGVPTRLVLVRAVKGGSKKPGRHALGSTNPKLSAPAELVDGSVRGRLDLTPVLPDDDEPTLWALRLQFDLHDTTFSLPVSAASDTSAEIHHGGRVVTLRTQQDSDGRTLIAMESHQQTRGKLARWARRP